LEELEIVTAENKNIWEVLIIENCKHLKKKKEKTYILRGEPNFFARPFL